MDGRQTLGKIIRSRRQELRLTQEELAARIGGGVRQAEVSRLESDRIALPRRQRLERIAAALGMSVGELLAGAGWTGAEQAFRPAREHTTPEVVDTPALVRTTGPTSEVLVEPLGRDVHAKLQEALALSHEIRTRTTQLLEVSAEVAAVWMNSSNARRPRRDAS